jgi:hypothetical protein
MLVVRKLGDKRTNLFALANKNLETGLCGVKPPPQKITDILFFYREWRELAVPTGQYNARLFNTWKSNLNKSADQYLDQHQDDFIDEHQDDFIDEPVQPAPTKADSAKLKKATAITIAFVAPSCPPTPAPRTPAGNGVQKRLHPPGRDGAFGWMHGADGSGTRTSCVPTYIHEVTRILGMPLPGRRERAGAGTLDHHPMLLLQPGFHQP